MSIARVLAELAVNTAGSAIPQSSRDAGVKMLLDTIGCAYAGMDAPGIAELNDLERELAARGVGTVFFSGSRLALPCAAFCNAAMIHAMDFDNNYPGADIHIMSIVVPVALACAEADARSGGECMDAVILGVEVAARIAKPYMRARRQHAYFLTTSLVGGWGGVAAAARLLGLSVPQTVHAMGIYYAHTCGNRQALLDQALTKRMQPAIAARAALYSALLARKGFTGPEYTFEGPGGFYSCYTLDPPPAGDEFRGSASLFGIEELVIKRFPTCGIHHANIISALHLRQRHGLRHEDIERVEFFLKEGGGTLVSMPFVPGAVPQIAAQFCAPYAIALALVRGGVRVRDFRNEVVVGARDVADLAKRTIERTGFADMRLRDYPVAKEGCRYTKVYLRDGTVLEHECHCSRAVQRVTDMNMADVEMKFRDCVSAGDTADRDRADRVRAAIRRFPCLEKTNELTGLLGEW